MLTRPGEEDSRRGGKGKPGQVSRWSIAAQAADVGGIRRLVGVGGGDRVVEATSLGVDRMKKKQVGRSEPGQGIGPAGPLRGKGPRGREEGWASPRRKTG